MTALRTLPLDGTDVARPTLTLRDVVFTHGKYVWRLLRYLGVADRDLDDVCQDVFTTAHEKLDHVQDEGLRPWLHTMCVLHAKNYRRRARHHRETLMEDVADLSESVPPLQEEDLEVARKQKLLLALLDQLDEDRRTIFVLHAIEEVPMDQVAKIVGCPLSTAYFRFKRACTELEKGMAPA